MAKNTIQKNIRFPAVVIKEVEKKSKRLGIGFNEYVKYLVMKDVEDIDEETIIPGKQLIADIEQARKDSKAGKLPTMRSPEDIDKFFEKLLEEDD